MKIINYRNITYAEVEKIIKELIDKGLELDQITMRVYEYVSKFTKCRNSEKLVETLKSMGFKEITAVMIANIVPNSVDELRALLNFENEVPSEEKLKEVLNKINDICS